LIHRESIKKYARKNKVEIVKVRKINDVSFVEYVKDQRIDYLISIGCPQILRKELLRAPLEGCVNLHGGYLPDYPGVFSAFWNLMDESNYAGATVHLMDEKVDSGQILLRERFPISSGDTLISLYSRIADLGVKLLRETLIGLESNKSFDPISNIHNRYFSFPNRIDRKKFRAKGLRVF
jgi:methionyl-tRNA formyltransferase